MTTVAIFPDSPGTPETKFRAVSKHAQSEGRTAGAALDALTKQLDPADAGMIVVVQNLRGDEFFSEAQQHRLRDLMDAWRNARDAGQSLPPMEQAELNALVDAELRA